MDTFQRQSLWMYNSEFQNISLLHTFNKTVLYQPLIEYEEIQPAKTSNQVNFMSAFSGGQACKKALRLLSSEPRTFVAPETQLDDVVYFCKYAKNMKTDERKFSLLPYYGNTSEPMRQGQKFWLLLNDPKKVIVINNRLLVAIQKKCITLYEIDDGHLFLKDFDSIGVGNKLVLVEISHISYKDKQYLLVFGNQKEDIKPYFKVLVYELINNKLRFIKKSTIINKEVFRPIILFDHYPNQRFSDEKFCLIVGGYSDYSMLDYNFSGIQIHMHLLLNQWLTYPISETRVVPFIRKHTITTGKAIKLSQQVLAEEKWLLLCTEYQTISQVHLHFGQDSLDQFHLKSIDIHTKKFVVWDNKSRDEPETLFYHENSVYLMRVPESHPDSAKNIPYRLYWTNKTNEKIKSIPVDELLREINS